MLSPEKQSLSMTDADRETAAKFGFDPSHPFPLEAPHPLDPAKLPFKRTFGRATYRTNAIAGVVTITATGEAPNLNTVVQLVQMKIMVWPPRFALYFLEPEIVLPTIKPFTVEATFHTFDHLDAVIVQDADGVHAVPVENF